MKLSPRLLRIAAKVLKDAVVADIGSDHGLLPVYLVATGQSPRAIASDARRGPLSQAEETIRSFDLLDKIDLRLGEGLSVLEPYEADVVVMAGFGAAAMVKTLADAATAAVRRTVRRFVFQPMGETAKLRRWLVSEGYTFADEDLVRDGGIIYEIVVAEKGVETVADAVLYEIGPRLKEKGHPLFAEFLMNKVEKYRKILEEIENGRGTQDPKYWEFAGRLQKIEEILRDVR